MFRYIHPILLIFISSMAGANEPPCFDEALDKRESVELVEQRGVKTVFFGEEVTDAIQGDWVWFSETDNGFRNLKQGSQLTFHLESNHGPTRKVLFFDITEDGWREVPSLGNGDYLLTLGMSATVAAKPLRSIPVRLLRESTSCRSGFEFTDLHLVKERTRIAYETKRIIRSPYPPEVVRFIDVMRERFIKEPSVKIKREMFESMISKILEHPSPLDISFLDWSSQDRNTFLENSRTYVTDGDLLENSVGGLTYRLLPYSVLPRLHFVQKDGHNASYFPYSTYLYFHKFEGISEPTSLLFNAQDLQSLYPLIKRKIITIKVEELASVFDY